MPFVLKVDECESSPKWCSVPFNCPMELRDRLGELADQAGWSRGKFIYHLLEKLLPDVVVEAPEISAAPLKPERIRFPGV